MGRAERKLIIERIEALRASRVLAFVTGDRPPVPGLISDDAVRQIYRHLRDFGRVPKLDLFIYSRGGAIDVPWRIVTALRRAADSWNVLIPFRANSAATLLSLGADQIVLGAQGELGPIDCTLGVKRMVSGAGGQGALVPDQVSVEDVMAYVKFTQEQCGLTEQAARTSALDHLVGRVDAVSLGSIYRTHSHIRDVARRVLTSRATAPAPDVLEAIVKTLAEQTYAHGHAIGLEAAREIGLPVSAAEPELDAAMWSLLEQYEEEMKLLHPLDPTNAVATSDVYNEDACIAAVESRIAVDRFVGRIEVTAKRQMPPTLNVSFNLNLPMPGIEEAAPNHQQMVQQVMQAAKQQITQQAQQAVHQALSHQAPLAGVETGFRDGHWERTI